MIFIETFILIKISLLFLYIILMDVKNLNSFFQNKKRKVFRIKC
jgi:hypothetical protein